MAAMQKRFVMEDLHPSQRFRIAAMGRSYFLRVAPQQAHEAASSKEEWSRAAQRRSLAGNARFGRFEVVVHEPVSDRVNSTSRPGSAPATDTNRTWIAHSPLSSGPTWMPVASSVAYDSGS